MIKYKGERILFGSRLVFKYNCEPMWYKTDRASNRVFYAVGLHDSGTILAFIKGAEFGHEGGLSIVKRIDTVTNLYNLWGMQKRPGLYKKRFYLVSHASIEGYYVPPIIKTNLDKIIVDLKILKEILDGQEYSR